MDVSDPAPSDYSSDDGVRVVDWRIVNVETNDDSLIEVSKLHVGD